MPRIDAAALVWLQVECLAHVLPHVAAHSSADGNHILGRRSAAPLYCSLRSTRVVSTGRPAGRYPLPRPSDIFLWSRTDNHRQRNYQSGTLSADRSTHGGRPSTRTWTARRFVFAATKCAVLTLLVFLLVPDAKHLERVDKKTETETDSETQIERGKGVHPIYLKLLREAERRSALDFATSHTRGEKGFVIGPTEGDDFSRHTGRALRNARRLRNILRDNTTKIALMTSLQHKEILDKCLGAETTYHAEECRLWANGSLFDDVVVTKDGEYQHNDNHTLVEQGSSKYWLKALGGYRYAPYKTSIFLDSDAYPCPGVEDLFHVATPHGRLWQPTSLAPADFAAGIDQFPFGSDRDFFTPGDKNVLTDFRYFPERNTGTTIFHFHRPLAHTFAHFIPLVAEHIYNHVATNETKVVNDQGPFRVALYLFQRLRSEFGNHHIPMHTSCRAYPGWVAGTNGFANGMFPLQANGQHCKDCYCTPCLIAHLGSRLFVTINGQTGWEEDFDINRTVMETR